MVKEVTTQKHLHDVSNKIVGKDEVERLIADYGDKDSSVAKNDELDYLRSAEAIAKVRIISFPKEKEPRVDAIIREYKDYSLMRLANYSRFAFCIEFSKTSPLLMEELQGLTEFFTSVCPSGSEPLLFTGIDTTLKDKLLVTIICSK